MIGSSVLFAYSTNICIHCLVSGQRDWAHVTRVAKSCARRSVSSAAREEGVLVQDAAFLCVIATVTC